MFKIFTDEQVNEIKAAFIKLELKEVNESNGTFKVVASDETIDRHGEVIKVAGWDWHNFMKNPIMLINHNYWDLDAVGGKATQIYVDGGKLIIE
ncbi:MAG: hypothetical protein EKK61_04175 [Rickettsiales bacterium]|nr:MAG: hypothetical protein EKK61_04175 [Rickettsiales bacterium]